MKKNYGISLLLAVLTLWGCGSKKTEAEKEQREVSLTESIDGKKGIQRMKVSTQQNKVKCGGDTYVVNIERCPDEKLPLIHSAAGNYVDNRITLSVQKDGKTFFKKSFTRSDFIPYVTFKETDQFLFEGLVVDEINTEANKALTFAASLSYPDSDLYIPFQITINKQGKSSISLDENTHE